ncbi:hypothetical protein Peur_046002 [Populus x canadensis]
MALSKATLIAVLALAFTVLSVHAAAPMSAPAPAPTAAAAGIYPSLGSVFVAAIVALVLGSGLKI